MDVAENKEWSETGRGPFCFLCEKPITRAGPNLLVECNFSQSLILCGECLRGKYGDIYGISPARTGE